jgi:hypothetical protein
VADDRVFFGLIAADPEIIKISRAGILALAKLDPSQTEWRKARRPWPQDPGESVDFLPLSSTLFR